MARMEYIRKDTARGRTLLLEGHCIQMSYHNQVYERAFTEMLSTLADEGHQVIVRPLKATLPPSRWRRLAPMWQHRECHFFIQPGSPDLRCPNCRPENLVMRRLLGQPVSLVDLTTSRLL